MCNRLIDEEIAILSVKLKELLENEPETIDLRLKVANTTTRLVKTHYNIFKEQKQSLKESISKVLAEIALPLSLKTLTK